MGKKNKRPYDVYKCYECGFLHVGRYPNPDQLGPLCKICYTPISENRLKEKLTTCCKNCEKEQKTNAQKSVTNQRPTPNGQRNGNVPLEDI